MPTPSVEPHRQPPARNGRAGNQRPRSSLSGTWCRLAAMTLLVALMGACLPAGRSGPADHPAVGRPMPTVELEGLTGTTASLELDDLRGQVVLVNFWATWCPPCLMELPHLADLAARMETRPDFRLIAVSVGVAQTVEEFKALRSTTQEVLDQLKVDLPVFADPDGVTFSGFVGLGDPQRAGVPTTILLDREGIIRGVWQGYRPGQEEQMEQRIRQLLESGAPSSEASHQ